MSDTTLALPRIDGWRICDQDRSQRSPEAINFKPTSLRTPRAVINRFPGRARFSNAAEAAHFWDKRNLTSDYANQFLLFPGVQLRCTGYVPHICVSGDIGFLAMICAEDFQWTLKGIPSMDGLKEHAGSTTIRIALVHE